MSHPYRTPAAFELPASRLVPPPVRARAVARAIALVFFGPDGREGTNAVVRLEQPALERPETAGWLDVWVDRIHEVRRLDPG